MSKIKNLLFTIVSVFLCSFNAWGQNGVSTIIGKIVDVVNEPIIGAQCVLLNHPDSTQITGTTTNVDGVFELKASKDKEYILHISFIGFETYISNIALILV